MSCENGIQNNIIISAAGAQPRSSLRPSTRLHIINSEYCVRLNKTCFSYFLRLMALKRKRQTFAKASRKSVGNSGKFDELFAFLEYIL